MSCYTPLGLAGRAARGMVLGIQQLEILLVTMALVAIFARRLRVPYSVCLLLAGLALGLLPIGQGFALTRELVFDVLLPPLVFEAAINIRWPSLRKDLLLVGTLATVGVGVSAAIIASGLAWVSGWSFAVAWVFAALISATDPVAVIALFKEHRGHGRVRLLVESESLVNDGTAAVAFVIALAAATPGGSPSVAAAASQFVVVAGGGVLAGAAVAGAGLLLVWRTQDHLVELVLTTATAYGAFLLAEQLGLSGILATLTAGLIVGNVGPLRSFSTRAREIVEPFWEFAAFLANSMVFLLIGVREAQISFARYWPDMAAAIGLVLLGRAVSVYGISLGFRRSRWRMPAATQHVLCWGGLRGALALALVLGLPEGFPQLGRVTACAFAVVSFSLIVQGMTIGPLVRKAMAPPAAS